MSSSTPPDHRLVLVIGSTRSGTSMAAGTLHHLGLHVPLPVLRANESNPAGFFESTWPIEFHRRLLDRCLVGQTDARPEAFEHMRDAIADGDREALRSWLSDVFAQARQAVVKDPRASWVPRLWLETADALDAVGSVVMMVRHPAEVVASRTTYYHAERKGGDPWRYRVRNLCAWINVNTGAEHRTRGARRVIARYDDLASDWRSVVESMRGTFGLELDLRRAASVDAFIDPGLRRHEPSWAGMDLPPSLVEVAEGVWQALSDIAGGRDGDATRARLDALGAAYARQMAVATAMAHDASTARVRLDRQARDPGAAGAAGAVDPTGAAGAAGAVDPTGAAGRGGAGRLRRLARRWVPRPLRERARRARR